LITVFKGIDKGQESFARRAKKLDGLFVFVDCGRVRRAGEILGSKLDKMFHE
jgi:hypothetical protein